MRLTEKDLEEIKSGSNKRPQERMNTKDFNKNFEIDSKPKFSVRAVEKTTSKTKKNHKFKAEATESDGIKFPSKKEAKTYDYLKLLERDGQITDLKVNAQLKGEEKLKYVFQTEPFKMWYEPDFEYFDVKLGKHIVADAKGVRTDAYKRKKRLMKKMFDIEIKEF